MKFINYFVVLICLFFALSSSSIAKNSNTDKEYDSISISGEINDKLANETIKALQKIESDNKSTPILVFINSGGGDVLSGGRIIDAFMASKRPIYTIDIEMTASMAAIIFEHGDKRFMFPHSILMFHMASSSYSDQQINQISSELILISRLTQSYNIYISKRASIPLNILLINEANEWWLLSPDAIKNKLADGIFDTMDYPIK